MKIVLLESLAISNDTLDGLTSSLLDKGHEFIAYDGIAKNIEIMKERVRDADILIITNSPLSGEVIKAAKKLKYVAIAFTGFDHVDLDVCKEKGIKVSNAQNYATEAVAELTIAMIISLLRNIILCNEVVRKEGTKLGLVGNELNGKVVGIIGTGAIGFRVAELLKVFHCKLLAYSRTESSEAKKLGVEYVSLEELLSRSDIVSLHLPLNKKTKGLISAEKIAYMKKDAILINTARGPIVDSASLAQALNNEDIAGAGIDVFEIEPPIDTKHPLLNAMNTIATPHVAFATEESMIKRANIVFDNVHSWLKGEEKNIVL